MINDYKMMSNVFDSNKSITFYILLSLFELKISMNFIFILATINTVESSEDLNENTLL